jgi:hypothetical protein
MAIKIDKNMQSSGKSNLPGLTRGSTSKQQPDSKDKVVASESKTSSTDPLKELMEVIKPMEANHVAQLNAMQNRLIAMERSQANRFQPRKTVKDGREKVLPKIKGHLISWKQQIW